MNVQICSHLDPAVECILALSRSCAQKDGSAVSVADDVRSLSELYDIPPSRLSGLVEPLAELETELLEALRPRRELWDELFYTGSAQENLLAWGFFYLERQGAMEAADLPLRRRLIALLLNCGLSRVEHIEDPIGLSQFLDGFPCSSQTKWVCSKLWLQPMRYYENYRALVELAAPIVARYDELLQPRLAAVDDYIRAVAATDFDVFWSQLNMTGAGSESLIVYPIAINFKSIGITWDHTMPGDAAYLMVGILYRSVQELVRSCSNNSEYLAERLKAISDPRRLEILKALKKSPLYSQEITELLSLSPATISHHMSSLVASSLVCVDKQGTRVRYSLAPENMDSFLHSLRNTLM